MDQGSHPVGHMMGLIDSILGNHGQDLSPEQQQQLGGFRNELQQNPGYYQQNPDQMQNIFNSILGVAAPFILNYGINAILGRGQQGGLAGGLMPGGSAPSGGYQPGFAPSGGYQPGYAPSGGDQPGYAPGGGQDPLGGLIAGALPGILGGLGGILGGQAGGNQGGLGGILGGQAGGNQGGNFGGQQAPDFGGNQGGFGGRQPLAPETGNETTV